MGLNEIYKILSAGLIAAMVVSGCGAANTPEGIADNREVKENTAAAAVQEATDAGTAGESVLQQPAKTLEVTVDHKIVLSSVKNADGTTFHQAQVDGTTVPEFDYTWHADPSGTYDEVKNSPAEYFTGTEPDTDAPAYIAHDIRYFPEIDTAKFKKVNYDGEWEYAAYYESDEYKNFIFGLLPEDSSNELGFSAQMMHSETEAYDNAVLHITKPGTYEISGEWQGQILVDLGDQDETFTDENAKVNVLLKGVNVDCSVAPAMIFYSAYESDHDWENRKEYTQFVDTDDAGVNVIVADDSTNQFNGTNVYRMLKAKNKKDDDASDVPVQKKARKTDAAFYSYVTMNIYGEKENTGVLNIRSGFEGLDSELHLTINGGNINIFSQDDGINTNEDGVSVTAFNGGNVHIMAGLGNEGDGVDSNGFLIVNGGTVIASANPRSDSGLDSDSGSYIYGGNVLALGSAMDWAESDEDSSQSESSGQAVMNLRFMEQQSADEAIVITDSEGKVVFAYDAEKDEVAADQARSFRGAIISCPGLKVGDEYSVYIGGDVTGTDFAGLYDPATVTSFSEEAVQQCYTGREGFGRPGGFGGQHGERPNDRRFERGAQGERPEGMESGRGARGERPEGMESGRGARGEHPEGMESGRGPQGERPDGWDFGYRQEVDYSKASAVFRIETRVSNFSGVTDQK